MSLPDAPHADTPAPSDRSSFAAALASSSLVVSATGALWAAAYGTALLFTLGRASTDARVELLGAGGFAWAALGVALAAESQLEGFTRRNRGEVPTAVIDARAAARRGLTFALVAFWLALFLFWCAVVPALHAVFSWSFTYLPVTGVIILVASIAVYRAYLGQKVAESSGVLPSHRFARWGRAIGLGVVMLYLAIYGIELLVGIIALLYLLVLQLFSHLPRA